MIAIKFKYSIYNHYVLRTLYNFMHTHSDVMLNNIFRAIPNFQERATKVLKYLIWENYLLGGEKLTIFKVFYTIFHIIMYLICYNIDC